MPQTTRKTSPLMSDSDPSDSINLSLSFYVFSLLHAPSLTLSRPTLAFHTFHQAKLEPFSSSSSFNCYFVLF